MKNKRIEQLDSLRGLAALSVMFSHFMIVYNINFIYTHVMGISETWYRYSPFHFFWAGHEAVIFFFVLSGFCLALPFLGETKVKYNEYIIKRFLRIYIPCIVSVILAVFLKSLINLNKQTSSDWVNTMWVTSSSTLNFIEHLMLGRF
ncbi:MAG TPA: acyltransferase family protein [Niallia sp.]|nr:acyltransferase family protein [Niallia sp.]